MSHRARLSLDRTVPSAPRAWLRSQRRKGAVIGLVIAMLLCVYTAGLRSTTSAAAPPFVGIQTPALYTLYLPVAAARTDTIFGLGTTSLTPERGLDDIVALGTTWVRSGSLLWRDVEPVEGGGYHWDAPGVRAIEQEMLNASSHNLKLILIVRGSPAWATSPYKADCAPINPAKYARFAKFMAAAVERYSSPPYNVMFWEIGNEPDAPIFPIDSGFGCWGVEGDPYYGGRAYGALLKAVYPAMKTKAPEISVLNGGLLLDRPYNPADGSGRAARFMEGVFMAGAGDSFDVLSYHSYSYYDGTVDGTRGATDWKIGYLRDLMLKYNVSQKPLLNSEAALLCIIPTPDCRQAQADAIGRYYTRAINDGLLGHLWYLYDSDGFNNTALVEPSDITVQRPTYQAYRNAAAVLGNAQVLGPLAGQEAGVEGYRFARGMQTITVFWSDVSRSAAIPVQPDAVVRCVDRDGTPVMCDNTGGTVALIARSGPTYVIEQ
jgi:hypothetical protein